MRILIIGGSGFVGRRLSLALSRTDGIELHVLNRRGAVPGIHGATVHRGNRNDLMASGVPSAFDVVFDSVCFDDRQAKAACRHFAAAKRYVFISSQSVYDLGANIAESAFDPHTVDLTRPPLATDPGAAYQEGKRRAEAAFAQIAAFPTLSVRFPFILGPDDPTRRLTFHLSRIGRGAPLFVPEPAARISLIHADDAAAFLEWSIGTALDGGINVASPNAISLADLIHALETAVGRKAVLSEAPDAEPSSYGPPADAFMSVARATAAGFTARPIGDWLPALARETWTAAQ